MTGLELGHGEGYCGATANPMSGDLPDAVGDVLQTGGDGVAARVTDSVAVAAAAWRVWTCDSRTEARYQDIKKRVRKIGESNA